MSHLSSLCVPKLRICLYQETALLLEEGVGALIYRSEGKLEGNTINKGRGVLLECLGVVTKVREKEGMEGKGGGFQGTFGDSRLLKIRRFGDSSLTQPWSASQGGTMMLAQAVKCLLHTCKDLSLGLSCSWTRH